MLFPRSILLCMCVPRRLGRLVGAEALSGVLGTDPQGLPSARAAGPATYPFQTRPLGLSSLTRIRTEGVVGRGRLLCHSRRSHLSCRAGSKQDKGIADRGGPLLHTRFFIQRMTSPRRITSYNRMEISGAQCDLASDCSHISVDLLAFLLLQGLWR